MLGRDSLSRAYTERQLGVAAWYLFDYSRAAIHFENVTRLRAKVYGENDWRTFDTRIDSAFVALERRDYSSARLQARSIYDLLKSDKPELVDNMIDVLAILAESNIALHDLSAADRFVDDLLALSTRDNNVYAQTQAWIMESRLELEKGHIDTASKWIDQLLSACDAKADPFSAKYPYRCPTAMLLMAKAAKLKGNVQNATVYIHSAIDRFVANGNEMSPEIAEAYIVLADIAQEQGDIRDAKQALTSAIAILTRDFGVTYFRVTQLRQRISSL